MITDAGIGQRQSGGIGGDAVEAAAPAAVARGLAQHGHGNVEGQHLGLRVTLFQQCRAAAGTGADIDDPLRSFEIEIQPRQQFLLHFALQHIVLFVGFGRGAEVTPDMLHVEMEVTHARSGSSSGSSPAMTRSA